MIRSINKTTINAKPDPYPVAAPATVPDIVLPPFLLILIEYESDIIVLGQTGNFLQNVY